MDINKIEKDGKMVFELNGRLDTNTYSKLEATLSEYIDGAENIGIILDFKGLKYVSSAGLRVLLLAQKKVNKKGGQMVLTNVIPSVTEVFDVTGFTGILTIE